MEREGMPIDASESTISMRCLSMCAKPSVWKGKVCRSTLQNQRYPCDVCRCVQNRLYGKGRYADRRFRINDIHAMFVDVCKTVGMEREDMPIDASESTISMRCLSMCAKPWVWKG